MDTLLQDVRYAFRMLAKKPGFTIAAVLAVALGIGANTAIFSVVNTVLLRSLPYKDPDKLTMVLSHKRDSLRGSGSAAFLDVVDWEKQSQTFEDMAVFRQMGYTLTGVGEPERITGARVSADFFPLLGVEAIEGRTFRPEEDQRGSERVVVLGHGLWQRRFGGDPSIIGQSLSLNAEGHTVIGVLPPDFKFPLDVSDAEMWTAVAHDGDLLEERGAHYLKVVGRLKPGVSINEAQLEMNEIASRLEQQYPAENTGRIVNLNPMFEHLVSGIRRTLVILLGIVGLVLLIACANVANLMLARAAARTKEIAIRTALGASRRRVVRQLLTESLILALLGGGAGLLLALWGIELLIKLGPRDIPRLDDISIDGTVLWFTAAASILTGIIFGLVPALKASKPDLNESLKEGSRGTSEGFNRYSLRNLLVVVQMALTLIPLVSAGLLVKSFLRLQQVNPGFAPENVLTMRVSLPALFDEGDKAVLFFKQATERIESIPGVESVGAVTLLPLVGSNNRASFNIKSRPYPENEEPVAEFRAVTPNYFRAMGIPVIRGRTFTEHDVKGKTGAIIINETMARRYWPGEDPLGQVMSFGVSVSDNEPDEWEIVAIVGDLKHFSLDSEAVPEMYIPHAQQPWTGMTMVARSSMDPTQLATLMRGQVLSLDRNQPVSDVRTMSEVVGRSIAQQRFYLLLFALFAVMALVLAAVGIFGVMSYSVTERTREIGIRMALGAQTRDVLRHVVGQGMLLTLAGVVIGLVGSFLLTRFMANMLYEVDAFDPVTFAAISLLLALVALIACYIPARRATRVDPMVALRYE
ncbi:MAG TPA: ABC transporter permease [Blastocatellia bacterium]|nr:ABC transporter permease [Blastocatellia bacterium]